MRRRSHPPAGGADEDADDERATAGDPRHRPRDERGEGRSRRSGRHHARTCPERLFAGRVRWSRLGRAGPRGWWSAVVTAVRALRISETAEVVAIGVDGHGPTLVAVDPRGEATRPAITFLDTRSASEADELAAATGVLGWGLGGLPAALWVERHEPAVAAATCWYLSTWEWLAFRLTGVAVAPLVPDQVVPDRRLVADAGVPLDRLPPTAAAGTVVGGLHRTRPPTRSVSGPGRRSPAAWSTRSRAIVGAGLLEPGDAYDPGGSAGGFGVYWDRPVEVAGGFVTPAPLAGRYSVGAAMAATGRALDWYRESILGGTIAMDALLAEAAATPPGADGLVFLPYLAGERSPIWDPEARGVLAGLTLAHGRGHVARAIVEASALAIRHVAQPMLAAGVQVTRDARLRRPGPERRSGTRSRPT